MLEKLTLPGRMPRPGHPGEKKSWSYTALQKHRILTVPPTPHTATLTTFQGDLYKSKKFCLGFKMKEQGIQDLSWISLYIPPSQLDIEALKAFKIQHICKQGGHWWSGQVEEKW